MKAIFAPAIAAVVLAAAAIAPAQSPDADTRFRSLSQQFLNGYLAWRPLEGTMLGLHEYDGRITDFSRASINGELGRLKGFDRQLARIKPESLSPRLRYDRQILQTAVRTELFHFEDMAVYTRNPMTYAEALDLNIYAKRDFAPIESRLRSVVAIEKTAPALFAAARSNLDQALPKPYVEAAIEMAKGGADFLSRDLADAFKGVGTEAAQKEFAEVNTRAAGELRDFATWLEKEKLPSANAPFALGADRFQKMLRETELVDWSPEKILDLGLKRLQAEQRVFTNAARVINPAKNPVEVFKDLQREHPTAENLIPDTRRNLEAIREFVIQHHIIGIPSDVRVKVEETPRYLRATSFASMDTPGPFELRAKEAYYYVTPVEADWTPQQKEEWLTSFSYYDTDVTSIHEAYPGHYVQFLWLNASGASTVAKIFNSYCFMEGWAHYCEQMLIDEGFGSSEAAKPTHEAIVRAAKYRLAQSDESLLRICRLCVSIKMHCQGISLEEATKFFQDNCYYERQPAYEEARRGTFDPQYLLYTLGKLQILKLRRDWQKQEGANFSLEKFHDALLQHGAPPIRLLREQLLKDPKTWDELF